MQGYFYLIGDDISSAQTLDVDPLWKFQDLQRACGLSFHVTQPLGM